MARRRKVLLFAFHMALDILFSLASFGVAVLLAGDFAPSRELIGGSVLPGLIYTALIVLFNTLFRTYVYRFVYISIIEALKVFLVSVSCFAAIIFLHFSGILTYSLSLSFIYLIIYTLISELYRFSLRSAYVFRKLLGLYGNGVPPKNVLVISDRDTAGLIIRRLLQGKQLNFRPAAVLTDEPGNENKILGVRVFAGTDDIAGIITRYAVREIVLQADYCGARRIGELKRLCNHMGVEIKVFQKLHSIGADSANGFRKLNLEDLLGRSEIKLEKNWIEQFITGKTVLVTGAAGSIGAEICRQCAAFGCKELYLFDIDENGLFELEIELDKLDAGVKMYTLIGSIRDVDRLDAVFSQYKPEVCFHAAAHKHVPMMEKNPCEAIKNNIFGTMNVLDACNAHSVKKLIVISSDKAVNPSSVMGATKRVTEMLVQVYGRAMETEVAAVRFGNVLGSQGSVIPLFQKQIEEGGPVTLTHPDMERYFMTIAEAVQLVLQTGALASQGEIFVFDMGRSMKIYDLAVDMIRLSGLEPDKDIELRVTGLRPGEKLFEELRLDTETMDTTKHKSIFVCKPMKIDKAWLDRNLDYLSRALESQDEAAVVERLFELVPSAYRKPTMGTLNFSRELKEAVK